MEKLTELEVCMSGWFCLAEANPAASATYFVHFVPEDIYT